MSFLTVAFAALFYAAFAILVIGVGRKIYSFAKTPAPLKIPTTPAPTTQTGVVMRMFREVVFFESLFKSTKWTWLFGWVFHMALFAVLFRHLRYFQDPVWAPVTWVSPVVKYLAFAMIIGLLGLWARRLFVDRVPISRPRPTISCCCCCC
jgi:nitrate reductase gamma subunit